MPKGCYLLKVLKTRGRRASAHLQREVNVLLVFSPIWTRALTRLMAAMTVLTLTVTIRGPPLDSQGGGAGVFLK